MRTWWVPLSLAFATTSAGAADRYVLVSFGQALQIIGSEDPRVGGGLNIGFSRPEPRLTFRGKLSDLALETYYHQTRSPGASGQPPNTSHAVGILALARQSWPRGVYTEIGWGIQYTDRKSVDLDSQINSTPTFGIGYKLGKADRPWTLGIRLMHISNAGTKGRNQGQNQLFLVAGTRF